MLKSARGKCTRTTQVPLRFLYLRCDMKEIWKNVTGYENYYQVSNFGNVRSLDRLDSAGRKRKGRTLIPIVDNLGYCSVHLLKNGKTKTIRIHRLVALEFLENPLNYKEINHKDENKQNNSVKNLEWCDRKYNMNYGRMTHNFHSKRTSGENNGMFGYKWSDE